MSEKLIVKSAKIRGNKTLYAIALTILLTFSALVACMPVANAHTPAWKIPTYAYITVMPDPVGVNQLVTVYYLGRQTLAGSISYRHQRQ